MKTIALVSPNVSETMGGEAIKAFQYAKYLLANGRKVKIFCHARCQFDVTAAFAPDQVEIIDDDWRQKLAWKSVVLRSYIHRHFKKAVAQRIAATMSPADTIIHYIAPVSPVARRYPPAGFDFVIGPMTGNIY